MARTMQLKPNGHAFKKSIRRPDTNPVLSPRIFPLFNEKKRTHRSDMSGMAGKKVIFDKIADSKTETPRRIRMLERKDRIIVLFSTDGRSVVGMLPVNNKNIFKSHEVNDRINLNAQ